MLFFVRSLASQTIFKATRELYKTYNGVIQLHALHFRCVNIYDPEDIATILSSEQFNEKDVPYNFIRPWLNNGLITSNGHKWLQRRKMLTPAFHLNVLKKFVEVFVEHVEHFQKSVESEGANEKTNLYQLISQVTLKILCETSMGTSKQCSLESVFHKYFHAIEAISECALQRTCRVWYFFDWIYNLTNTGQKQKKIIEDLHGFSQYIIRNRRHFLELQNGRIIEENTKTGESKGRLAMIDLLFQNEKKRKIDESGIREEVDTFLFAGYDTISTALTFFIMRIANEPTIQEKIHQEIENIFGDSDRAPSFEDLNEMKYTECCIKESLRIYPSVPFISRYVRNEIVLGGYTIPAGTQVSIMIYDLHHREDIYPEPEKFIPERFLPSNQMKNHPFAFIPFSAGYRNCLGQKYAMLEMKTLISGLFRKYRVEPVTRTEDIVFRMAITLRTTQPIYAKIIKKKQNKTN
ncbi:unnamed protein product [Euphydryas editha]|uniref:Cytochrome P450 n=1 Tax=Euphydryas editha TaxID=104508 RepID=A0AAU9VER0_EUPED|nr:unnamed protein product [Euphydryas editha]